MDWYLKPWLEIAETEANCLHESVIQGYGMNRYGASSRSSTLCSNWRRNDQHNFALCV